MASVMTSRQSAELDHAFERNGWTSEDVKLASGGEMLAQLLLVVRGRAKVVVSSILTLLRTARIVAQPAVTTSKKYFEEAGVKLVGSNFEAQFYDLEVPATGEAELAVRKLEQNSLDAPILTELGEKAEISVSQFRAFLLANHGSSEVFIAYLRGNDGNLWAVRASWYAGYGGWSVFANSVARPFRWFAGHQVLSRN